MNRIINVYKEGWKVLLRLLWFSFLLWLVQWPLRYLQRYLIVQSNYSEHAIATQFIVLGVFIVGVFPFLLYWVSEWTGEFIGPRITRKRMRLIDREMERSPRSSGYGPMNPGKRV